MDELEAIWRFRYRIYIEELGKPLAAADHERRQLCDPADAGAHQLFIDGETGLQGVMRVHLGNLPPLALERTDARRFGNPQRTALVSRAMVAPGTRSSQIFAGLAQSAYRLIQAAAMHVTVLHCRPELVRLYGRLGFRSYGVDFIDPEVGRQVAMHLHVAEAPAVLKRSAASHTD